MIHGALRDALLFGVCPILGILYFLAMVSLGHCLVCINPDCRWCRTELDRRERANRHP